MESKQPQQTEEVNTKTSESLVEVSSHLADIELKLDHIIESINDTIHRFNIRKPLDMDREDVP